MGLLDMWRGARGSVLRKEYEDIMTRMEGANAPARRGFLNNVDQTFKVILEAYTPATPSERKALLKQMKHASIEMWKSGDWPSALGLGISMLNVESRFLPGADALYVRTATDQIIDEAASARRG